MIKHSRELQHVQTELQANEINFHHILQQRNFSPFFKKNSVTVCLSTRLEHNRLNGAVQNERKFIKVYKPLLSLFGVGPMYIKANGVKKILAERFI